VTPFFCSIELCNNRFSDLLADAITSFLLN
jgi:hypothetical protein